VIQTAFYRLTCRYSLTLVGDIVGQSSQSCLWLGISIQQVIHCLMKVLVTYLTLVRYSVLLEESTFAAVREGVVQVREE
jgi:hypothetical protein